MDKYSYISNAHGDYIDELYQKYKKDVKSVDPSWRKFFEGFEFSITKFGENGHADSELDPATLKETNVRNVIHAYRTRAHLKSDTNPVRPRRNHKVILDIEDFNLSEADLDTEFEVGEVIGQGKTSLKQILNVLKGTYLGHIGFEYMHIRDPEIIEFFKEKAENVYFNYNPPIATKKRILEKLNEAVVFENFLHTKYIGQKRFSLEGGESTIPALDTMINKAAELGVKEVIIGMAHRGRLNVLANIMGKTYEQIFSEFEGNVDPDLTMGDGDVKYHMGYSSYVKTSKGKDVYVKLSPNPSHLEAVDPVVLGYARAQIDDEYEGDLKKAVPILIHGDAAIAGQGIVYEIIQMAHLEGYTTGGTIHFVINNQMGFTTDYDDARSSIYCTDIAKITDCPVLHINGDDPEAVTYACELAIEYRQKFGKDFFIDLLCYRRHGHNESDEPKFTQPKLYNTIAKHPNPREIYSKVLTEKGDVEAKLSENMDKEFRGLLQDRLNMVKQNPLPYTPQKIEEEWSHMTKSKPEDFDQSPETGIPVETIEEIGKCLSTVPKGFKPLRQIEKLLKERENNFFQRKTLNWADAELLAYGSILLQGNIVRIAGQDTKRGTFSHRHSYLYDAETNEPYCNLNNIREGQIKLRIYNSLLSEFGALGYDYGYAMATPNALVVWEAQFGDFVNGAQVMIDQFITSAESKWQRMNGLVMLLPHGYEGQGPEHSSARLERFFQSSADFNMIVANLTTPANFFHALRRQLAWNFRKPLVIMSPKSLLRHPKVISPYEDFTDSKFREVIDDEGISSPDEIRKVLFCSGKIYFDLLEKREQEKIDGIALVRIEQLHPYPEKQIDAIFEKYEKASFVWVQEEPLNMGAWSYLLRIDKHANNMECVSRISSASPATGYAKLHKNNQEDIINKALEIN